MRHTLFALAVSLAACAAQSGQRPGAQSATAPNDPAAKPAKSDDDEKLCEQTAVTGTNITRLVCRTRAEEQAELNAARDWRQQDPMNHK
jgi:hypothetical protein